MVTTQQRSAGPDMLARFLDRLTSAGLHRALAHVAWHALLTVTVGSVAQEQARDTDQAATFDAVLDLTITGLLAAAQHPPTPQATAFLKNHELSHQAAQTDAPVPDDHCYGSTPRQPYRTSPSGARAAMIPGPPSRS
jgi:hypothetical protein